MKLNEKHLEVISNAAVQAAMDYLENDKQKNQRVKRDRRLRNTRLLLKNYRIFKIHARELKMEIGLLNDEAFLEDLDSDEFAVEAIKKSKARTIIMITFIDQMLEVFRVLSEKSDKPGDKRRYQVIYLLYIADEKLTIEKVAECLNVAPKTITRDIKDAVKTLSALIFGVDGIRIND
jgi:hypothetical protein